jgi:hypothetical protein
MGHTTIDSTTYPEVDCFVQNLLDTYDYRYGVGTMTGSVYDTAWVAIVCKTVSGIPQYLFPSSFMAILQAQLPDGSWTGHFDERVDSLKNSPELGGFYSIHHGIALQTGSARKEPLSNSCQPGSYTATRYSHTTRQAEPWDNAE